jgi:hypothetical protein
MKPDEKLMLDGTLDCVTGEPIGPACGFPRTKEWDRIIESGLFAKMNCPICKKRVKVIGLRQHCEDVHGIDRTNQESPAGDTSRENHNQGR